MERPLGEGKDKAIQEKKEAVKGNGLDFHVTGMWQFCESQEHLIR